MNGKKWWIGILLSAALFGGGMSAAANDPWYNIGYAIGASAGNSPAQSDKNFWHDPNYNFNNVKKVVVLVQVPQQNAMYIGDPDIVKEYEAFSKEQLNPVLTLHTIQDVTTAFSQQAAGAYSSQEEWNAAYSQYVQTHYDGILFVNIYAYYQNEMYGNVFMDFTLVDSSAQRKLLYYKDMRMNAPRSTTVGMIKRITNSFKGKIEKVRK